MSGSYNLPRAAGLALCPDNPSLSEMATERRIFGNFDELQNLGLFDFIVVGTGAGGGRIVLGLVNEIYHLNLYARIKIWFDQAQLEAQNSSNVTIPNRATSLSVAQV